MQYTRESELGGATTVVVVVVVVVNPLQQCGTDTVVTVARTVIFGRSRRSVVVAVAVVVGGGGVPSAADPSTALRGRGSILSPPPSDRVCSRTRLAAGRWRGGGVRAPHGLATSRAQQTPSGLRRRGGSFDPLTTGGRPRRGTPHDVRVWHFLVKGPPTHFLRLITTHGPEFAETRPGGSVHGLYWGFRKGFVSTRLGAR